MFKPAWSRERPVHPLLLIESGCLQAVQSCLVMCCVAIWRMKMQLHARNPMFLWTSVHLLSNFLKKFMNP